MQWWEEPCFVGGDSEPELEPELELELELED